MIIILAVQGIILVAHSKSGIFWIPCNSNFSVNEGSQFGSGVGKSAFYSKQKERHSKGERVPLSTHLNYFRE